MIQKIAGALMIMASFGVVFAITVKEMGLKDALILWGEGIGITLLLGIGIAIML